MIRSSSMKVKIPKGSLPGFSYRGKMIDISFYGRMTIDDGVLWDTKIGERLEINDFHREQPKHDAKEMADPKDYFNLASNLMAIPLHRKISTIGLGAVALVVMVINIFVGYHDQFSPEESSYFYSLKDSDGDSQSPLASSLLFSSSAGVAVWYAIRRQLRSYMVFNFNRIPAQITRDTVVSINELVQGKSGVDLKDIFVRVIAYNLEKGEYRRGSGSSVRTVSFSNPSRAVLLYERHVPLIPRNRYVEEYLEGAFSFDALFDLYPPNIVTKSHGLYVQWEVQLIHDKLVDQELIAEDSNLRLEDFYRANPKDSGAVHG